MRRRRGIGPARSLLRSRRRARADPRRATTSPRSGPPPSCRRFSTSTIDALLAADPTLRRTDAARRAARSRATAIAPRLAAAPRRGADLSRQRGQVRLPDGGVRLAGTGEACSIDAELDDQLSHMIRESSNQATQRVFARLTDTAARPRAGARRPTRDFKQRRLTVDALAARARHHRPALRQPDLRRRRRPVRPRRAVPARIARRRRRCRRAATSSPTATP